MSRNFRFATDKDLDLCARIADDGFEYHPNLRLDLPPVWRTWRRCGAARIALLEDDSHAVPVVIAFAVTLFVTDYFVEQLLRRPAPNVALRLVEEQKGHSEPLSVVLELPAIQAANLANALNLFLVHYSESFPAHYEVDDRYDTRNTMMGKLLNSHRGFGLKLFFYEVFGISNLNYAKATGMFPWSEYPGYFRQCNLPIPHDEGRPCLVGLTREQAQMTTHFGHTAAGLFASPKPKLNFSIDQQEILWLALFEQDEDAWIAARIYRSSETVKKRWSSIFQSLGPEFFQIFQLRREGKVTQKTVSSKASSTGQLVRGKEKRRLLLEYLRDHVEELQPRKSQPSSMKKRHRVTVVGSINTEAS